MYVLPGKSYVCFPSEKVLNTILQQGGTLTRAYMLSWKSVSSLGSLFSLIIICHEVPPSRSLDSPKSTLVKSRIVILFFVLFPSLAILNSSISLLSRPSLTFTSSGSSFLFVGGISASQSSMSECHHQCLHHVWIVPCRVAPSTDPGATQLTWFQNYMRYFGSLRKFEIFFIFFLVKHHGKQYVSRTVMWLFSHIIHQQLGRQKVLLANYDHQT